MQNNASLYDVLNNKNLTPLEKRDLYHEFIMFKTFRSRTLFSVMIELSPICNFSCEVCYIRRTNEDIMKSGGHVLRFDEWKYYIDELSDLNISGITLSGGECTLHPDFLEIYEYIYKKGMSISIITNGSSLTDGILKLFKEMPPSGISITLYGTSESTYEKFCRNASAYKKVIDNIDKLLSINIQPVLNYTCGRDNICDLKLAYEYAKKMNLRFRPTWQLLSYGLCDNNTISNYQITEKEYIETKYSVYGVSIEQKSIITDDDFSYVIPEDEIIKNGITCNAGRNTCAINWQGKIIPCIGFDAFCVDPHDVGGVKKCWDKLVEWADNTPILVECWKCIFRKRCNNCIAAHYNDTHEFGKPSPRLCFKVQHPEEAAKLQAEYDRRQAEKAKSAENNNKTETTPDQGVVS